MSHLVVWSALVTYLLVVLSWWLRHLLISLLGPLRLLVRPTSQDTSSPRVSVVIPARNERDRIADCVRTLTAQGAVVHEIIVVDDRSDDDTASVATEAAGADPRFRTMRIESLPPDWAGKAHACHLGGQAATSEWILFADADCRFTSNGINGAVTYAEAHTADFLTLWLAADNHTFWEHMLIPLCGAIILLWFPPTRANRPTSSLGYANGQFILVRREAYLHMGGHTCAKDAVIEDIPLAEHAKRSGLRLRAAVGPGIARVRMYTNFRETWNGWTRIYVGALRRPWKMVASIWSLIGGSLLPSIGAPFALLFAACRGWPANAALQVLFVLLIAHCIAVYSVSFRLWTLCHCRRRHLLLYPVSTVMVAAILVRAWWWTVSRRPIVWRGTVTGRRTT